MFKELRLDSINLFSFDSSILIVSLFKISFFAFGIVFGVAYYDKNIISFWFFWFVILDQTAVISFDDP